jgi:hypothetical protein
VADGHVSSVYAIREYIDSDIPQKMRERIGHRFECNGRGSGDAGSEHRVSTDVRSNIDEEIGLPQHVKHECHVFELAEPDVEILGCAAHPIGHQEFRLIDEWDCDCSPHQAAAEEPARGPDECPEAIVLV